MELILLVLRTAIGILIAVFVWLVLALLPPGVRAAAVFPLAAATLAGVLGGVTCARLAGPDWRAVSLSAGIFLSGVLFGLMLLDRLARPDFDLPLEYWPLAIAPAFWVGAKLARQRT